MNNKREIDGFGYFTFLTWGIFMALLLIAYRLSQLVVAVEKLKAQ